MSCNQKNFSATITSDKINLRTRSTFSNNDAYPMIKGSIYQEKITILNVYVCN